jgi:cellulose synthase operon protein YhjQ
MAAAMPPDDVSTLMTRVHLDRSQYKVFETRRTSQTESAAPKLPASRPAARIHAKPSIAPVQSPAPRQGPSRPRWSVLNSLLGPAEKEQAAPQQTLLVPMLAVSAGSGGTGKTTILSTVARLLSGMGENIFLAYSDTQRTLPLHFGGQPVVPGRVRSLIPPTRDRGQLHLFANSQSEGGAQGGAQEDAQEEVRQWLPRNVNPMSGEVERVLCEITADAMSESQVLDLASIHLRVIVPDINSVVCVNRDLAEMDRDPEACQTFYLLNQYDASVPFHRDVRERLSAVLGERLLPFTIRRTDQIPEALAAGTTVVDYAPDAPVVEDFKWLAQWLRNSMQSNAVEPRRPIL